MSDNAELQRLRADVQGLGEVIKGMERTIAAERRARQIAEADNAKWMDVARRANTRMTWQQVQEFEVSLNAPHPGAAILAVIDQVRWAVENHYAPPPLVDAFMEMEKGR